MQKLYIYICLILFGARCAQITPLSGGKKDTTPPKVLSCNPANTSLNFSSKSIEVQFDEYITLKDASNQFIITPQTKEAPEFLVQGKKLKIVFNEGLLPNTTYKLAFGNAISDLNEANVLQNFEYIFSTGSSIDSLSIKGKIVSSEDKKPETQILVGLYATESLDSVIYKEKPLYICKTNSMGDFKFNYLPNRTFKIVAINDQNKNLLYDGSEERIAFQKEFVNPADSIFVLFNMFKEIPTKNFVKKSFSSEYGKAVIVYNKPQSDIHSVSGDGVLLFKQNELKDTLTVYYNNKFDTLNTYIYHYSKKIDSVSVKIFSETSVNKQLKENTIKYTLQPNFSSIVAFFDSPIFKLNIPVDSKDVDKDKIQIFEKTDTLTRAISFKLVNDQSTITSFKMEADYKPETDYVINFAKGCILNDSKRINDSVSYKFKTTAPDDYAQLRMKLLFPKKENYLVRLLNSKEQIVDERIIEFSLTSTSEKIIEYKNIIPGNYSIRIVEDANKNGIFDTGDYFLKTQSEIIYINPSSIKLLSGWEIENEWIVK